MGNGIFMSKLIFQMPLWGVAEENLLSSSQVVQNKDSRLITGKGKFNQISVGSEIQFKLDLTEKSFMARATRAYNQIPTEIRRTPKVETFKLKLKDWVQKNCPI